MLNPVIKCKPLSGCHCFLLMKLYTCADSQSPISLFTIHYECSTLVCLILISLCLKDLCSLCELRALDLTHSFPELCRNPHCHPAPKPAQSEGKKRRKYEHFAHHAHELFFREEKNQNRKSGGQTGSYQDQKRDLISIFLATGNAPSPPLPSELPKLRQLT